jgi:hypothetical protein
MNYGCETCPPDMVCRCMEQLPEGFWMVVVVAFGVGAILGVAILGGVLMSARRAKGGE